MTRSDQIKNITKHIISLPALPSIVAKLIELVDSPTTSARTIAKLLSSDQAITAKLLKLANSSYYAFANEITTVKHAIALLGFDAVTNLALSLSIVQKFDNQMYDDNFDRMKFWEHSLVVGLLCKKLAEDLRLPDSAEFFTIGILHDIGKLIIHEYLHKEYILIEKEIVENQCSSEIAEQKILKTDHSEIGGWLCDSWSLPKAIKIAIHYHHKPNENPLKKDFSSVVHLANYLANKLGFVFPDSSFQDLEINEDTLHNCSFIKTTDEDNNIVLDIDHYLVEALEEIKKAKEFLSLLQFN